MSADLEKRLDAVCESMDGSIKDFDTATKLCIDALTAVHQRIERLEQWMMKQEEIFKRRKKMGLVYKKDKD